MNASRRDAVEAVPTDTESAAELSGEAFRALRRGLVRSGGFAIYVCVCDARAVRDGIIDNLAASMPTEICRHDLDPEDDDILDTIVAGMTDTTGAIMLVGLDRLLRHPEPAERFFDRLNLRREEWPSKIGRPVVFWVSQPLLGRLTGGAPDFFDWRSDTIFFPDTTGGVSVLGERAWYHGADPRFSKEEQSERIEELEARIRIAADAPDARTSGSVLKWWDELADLRFARGELDEALRIRREEQLPVHERLGDVRSRAITMGQIADVLQARGKFDEALRIRREEQLPVYERLGDVRSLAITMGKIADVLQARGELDEALRIRREEELPVYERLGDVRSRALTMGQIAGVLQARGELDEALRIRREEELPAYERLGDIRSRAVALQQIASQLLDGEATDEDVGQALEALTESFSIVETLSDPEGIALVGVQPADVLEEVGRHDDALGTLVRATSALERLGDNDGLARVSALRQRIEGASDE